ncbi:MAG: MCP four helix bundle domain-containing protein [Gammaproteobacteria bacterium]
MLSRLRIGPKLLLAPAAVVLLLIFSSCAAYYTMVRQNVTFETVVHERAARLRAANALLGEARQAHANIYQLLTWMGASFSEARVDALGREIRQRHGSIVQRFAALRQSTADPGGQHLLSLGANAFTLYRRDVRDVLEFAPIDHSMSVNAMSKAERSFAVLEQHLASLAALEQRLSEAASSDARAGFQAATLLMPVLIVLSIVLALGITLAVRGGVLREVEAIGHAASGLARMDLRVPQRSYGADELADTSRALDASIRNLNRTLRDMRDMRDVRSSPQRTAVPPPQEVGPRERRRVRDAAAAASSLQRQAQALQRAVAMFKLDEEARKPPLRQAGGLEPMPEGAERADGPARRHLRLASSRPGNPTRT